MEEKKSKKWIIIILMITVIILVAGILWYSLNLKSVANEENAEVIKVNIEEGMGISSISNLLEKNNVIKSAIVMKIYTKLNGVTNLQAGKYEFNNSENLKTILSHMVNGEVSSEEIKITFIEGKNMRSIAETIANRFINRGILVFNR